MGASIYDKDESMKSLKESMMDVEKMNLEWNIAVKERKEMEGKF